MLTILFLLLCFVAAILAIPVGVALLMGGTGMAACCAYGLFILAAGSVAILLHTLAGHPERTRDIWLDTLETAGLREVDD